MGKKKDVEISTVKDLLAKVKGVNDVDITDILGIVPTEEDECETYIPVHQLAEIKQKLGEKKIVKLDDGSETLEPVYTEEANFCVAPKPGQTHPGTGANVPGGCIPRPEHSQHSFHRQVSECTDRLHMHARSPHPGGV